MEKIPRLSPEQRSNLVAYLDGELPENEAKAIEHVLAKSPTVQHDVEMLSRTWELLEQLPRLAGNENLTARTLATVKQDDAPRTMWGQSWLERFPHDSFRRGAITTGWLATLALAAVVGFSVTNRLIPDPSDDLLHHLPVIEKLDSYSNVGSIEFLRELEKRIDTFDDPQTPSR